MLAAALEGLFRVHTEAALEPHNRVHFRVFSCIHVNYIIWLEGIHEVGRGESREESVFIVGLTVHAHNACVVNNCVLVWEQERKRERTKDSSRSVRCGCVCICICEREESILCFGSPPSSHTCHRHAFGVVTVTRDGRGVYKRTLLINLSLSLTHTHTQTENLHCFSTVIGSHLAHASPPLRAATIFLA